LLEQGAVRKPCRNWLQHRTLALCPPIIILNHRQHREGYSGIFLPDFPSGLSNAKGPALPLFPFEGLSKSADAHLKRSRFNCGLAFRTNE
jgi:hypothetical protein